MHVRFIAPALFAAALLAALPAGAHDYKAGSLSIAHPWSRATPGGAKVGGGYMSITNTGTEPDRLTGGSLARAGKVEVHEMKMEGNVMKMRPMANGLEIKPGETVKLEPSGYHIMFIDLKQPLKQGEMVKGKLTFEKAGTIDVEYKVESIGAKGPGQAAKDAPMHMH
jgi:copper(I)-binding protein